ncbi:hypothetical protein MKX01_020139 [Papaver californicum]|nr:hypothetical protein MKX01_020139 [Papaver californicum]
MILPLGLKGCSGSRLSMMIGSSSSMYGDSNNNSEDLSGSMSSTAASVAKLEFDKSLESELTQENGELCNPKEKSSSSDSVPIGEHRKGGVARSKKKHRGEAVEPEKDHSYTNLRSSSVASMGVRNSSEMSSRGTHNEVNCDRPLPCEEVQIEYFKGSGGDSIEDASQYDLAASLSWKPKEKGKPKESESRQQQPTSCDPLVGSIVLLQSVQEALEKEIEHFREMGNNQITSFNESRCVVSSNTKICSIDQVIYGGHYSDQKLFSGIEDMETSSKLNVLRRKLEET